MAEMNNAWSGDDVKGSRRYLATKVVIYHKVNSSPASRPPKGREDCDY